MELWIRSQDKMKLIKIGFIECGEYEGTHFINGFPVNSIDNYDLGIYKSKERALEVLDEIQNFMTINHSYSGTYEEIDIRLKTDIASNMIKIYIMPEE